MSDLESYEPATPAPQPPPRVVGSPLPVGGGARAPYAAGNATSRGSAAAPPPGRALEAGASSFNLDSALSLLRTALPFVQKLLPILDGNLLGTAFSSMSAPSPKQPPAPPPPPPQVITVDLEPIENGLTELQSQHRELRGQFIEQNVSLKRVEDQLEMVREATDRNTLEQQELLEDLKTVGTKINLFVVVGLLLLAGSILLNILLYVHIKRVLP